MYVCPRLMVRQAHHERVSGPFVLSWSKGEPVIFRAGAPSAEGLGVTFGDSYLITASPFRCCQYYPAAILVGVVPAIYPRLPNACRMFGVSLVHSLLSA